MPPDHRFPHFVAILLVLALCAAAAGTRSRPAAGQDAVPAGDPPLAQADVDKWFDPSLRPVRQGNDVTELVDGYAANKSMKEEMEKPRGPMRVLYQFGTRIGEPAYPREYGGLVEGDDHNLYTTTQLGGAYGKGTVCQLTPDGKVKVIHSFRGTDGSGPQGGLTRGNAGEFYGTTYGGGKYSAGTVFSITMDGGFRTLWNFHNGVIDPPPPYPKQPTEQEKLDAAGSFPISPPAMTPDGTLFGVTSYSNNQQWGVTYKIQGAFKGLYRFKIEDLKWLGNLGCSLRAGTDGKCYGTAWMGGPENLGTIFSIDKIGGMRSLHRFTGATGGRSGGIMQARDGKLYGTASVGGASNAGVIYKMSPEGEYWVIHDFNISDGMDPRCGLVQGRGKDDCLYGVTRLGGAHGRGVFFKIRPSDGRYTVLHNFAIGVTEEGHYPTTAVVQHSNGKFYATTSEGGTTSAGIFYSMDLEHPDFIYALNWWMDDRFNLYGANIPSLAVLFKNADIQGVPVRAMLWDQKKLFDLEKFTDPQNLWDPKRLLPGSQNTQEVNDINALYNGAAILDNRTLPFGSHHQKILLVKGPEGLTGFCGGVDFNPDRVVAQGGGSPLHDVHCRIKGPAAWDLLGIFKDRWTDHPDSGDLDKLKGEPPDLSMPMPDPIPGKTCWVQIGRTYGNSFTHQLLNNADVPVSSSYKFAGSGEQSAARMILHAINTAKRFIYVEDQYFVDTTDPDKPGPLDVRAALIKKLQDPSFQHLTILITAGSLSDLPQVTYRRQRLIQELRKAGGQKVRVFFRSLFAPANPHSYVHAKVWIFDDEFAIIGSANTNRRSWTHDSEVVAGVCDQGDPTGKTYRLPHRLRMRLWAEHLNVGTNVGGTRANYESQLYDGVKSAAIWLTPPPIHVIEPYDENKDVNITYSAPGASLIYDPPWNNIIDPDGS